MLERRVWKWEALPLSTRATYKNMLAADRPPPHVVAAWAVRNLESLWPEPGQTQRPPRPVADAERELNYPFLAALASGGEQLDQASSPSDVPSPSSARA